MKCLMWYKITQINSGLCLAGLLCFVWGLNDLDWNASVHNLLSKLKKKSLATHNNTEGLNPSEKHQAKNFFVKFWLTFQTKELFILNVRKWNHLCLLELSLIEARYTKLNARKMFLIQGEITY